MTHPHAPERRRPRAVAAIAAAALAPLLASPASAQTNLRLDDVEVKQAVESFNLIQTADVTTLVRAYVSTPDTTDPVPFVDGIMRVWIDGEEADFSPVLSMNGPITAPAFPVATEESHHLSFQFIAPNSSDVDIEVVLNPHGAVDEPDYEDNVLRVDDLRYICKGEPGLAYVPINYTPGGGLPDLGRVAPDDGDAFVRAIFKPQDWNYYRSPVDLTWTQNINQSNNALLNELSDIRVFEIPGAGVPRPAFIYGWLPGNPFSGNGQANGIPGDAAFGNTELLRYQRTFAHELGHLLDEPHNSETAGQLGFDPERHLKVPLNRPRIQPPNQLDIMVAGQQTTAAFVSTFTYVQTHDDIRFICGSGGASIPGGGNGGNDALVPLEYAGQGPVQETLRVSGVVHASTGAVTLDAILPVELARPSVDRTDAVVDVVMLDADGRELGRIASASGRVAEPCTDPTHDHPDFEHVPLHVLVPATVKGRAVAGIAVEHRATGVETARLERSANDPVVRFVGATVLDDSGRPQRRVDFLADGRLTGPVRLEWAMDDADGDALEAMVQYSPDGGARWIPVATSIEGTSLDVDLDRLPASRGNGLGMFRVTVTDGFASTRDATPPIALGSNEAPDAHLLTPNNLGVVSQGAPAVLHASAWDREDTYLDDAQIEWSSSISGPIGFGRRITTTDLTPGLQTITLTVTDTDGASSTDSTLVNIRARDLGSPDINGDGVVDFSDLIELLAAWGPCDAPCPADFDFDGDVDFENLIALLSAWS